MIIELQHQVPLSRMPAEDSSEAVDGAVDRDVDGAEDGAVHQADKVELLKDASNREPY